MAGDEDKAVAPAAPPGSAKPELTRELTREHAVQRYTTLQEEIQTVQNKLFDLEEKRKEHFLVAQTLEGVDPKRTCYRLVGGVLVERTVGEMLPAVKQNGEQLQQVVKNYEELISRKQKELADFMTENNIQVRSAKGGGKGQDGSNGASSGQSVLVQ